MQIHSLTIQQLRNLKDCRLQFSDQLNIFYGDNGAGKSSLIESLYTLGNGRSFRTARHAKLIQHEADSFILFAELISNQLKYKIGLKRQRNGEVDIRLNRDKIHKLSELAKTVPMQILAPEQYELLAKGAGARRKLLDWGVFHVEHLQAQSCYLSAWQRCTKALGQRNKALKQAHNLEQLASWDSQIVPLSEQITDARRQYLAQLSPLYQQVLAEFLPDTQSKLVLSQGWRKGESLQQVMQQQYELDRKTGFTHASVQKADIKIYADDRLASDYLSRGQQKLVTTALKLAQLKLMQQQGQQNPVFLLDDIGAELDQHHQQVLLDFLAKQPENQQIFVTSVHLDPLKDLIKRYNRVKLFHVEHGVISEQQ